MDSPISALTKKEEGLFWLAVKNEKNPIGLGKHKNVSLINS